LGRLGRLFCFAVILAVAAPAFAGTTRMPALCKGSVRSGRQASCNAWVFIPHFNGRDSIDYATLVARIQSPSASTWRVSGSLTDARGVLYFAWYCAAQRSSITMGNETYVGRSCAATRKTVTYRRNGRTYTNYYVADTSRPQHLQVISRVGNCTPTGIRGCTFEAKATYVLAG
jgi:hypothetical protein